MIDAARTTISKRENARSTPDYSITQEFCGALTRNADRVIPKKEGNAHGKRTCTLRRLDLRIEMRYP